MSKTKDNILQQLDCESDAMPDIHDDLIDISTLNFSDHDTWLQPPNDDHSENSPQDLHAWLRADVEKESPYDSRRSIDTRTFTRPKKRSGRLSFESILEAHTPSNLWKSQGSPSNSTKRTDKEEAETSRHRRESTPPMLRPSNPAVSGLSSEDATVSSSGQESLEAFLNMSQSKGIDSFINLGEPEFSDALMNVSQPSILCTSLMSMTRDDLSQTLKTQSPPSMDQSQTSGQPGIEDSQILTESMMQTSMFGDFADVNFNDTFSKSSANVTVLENTSRCVSLERTFIASPEPITRDTLRSAFETGNFNGMDATYTPSRLNAVLAIDSLPNDPHASYIVNHRTYRKSDIKHALNDASFVVGSNAASDASYIVGAAESDLQNCDEHDETFDVTRNLNATFENTPAEASRKYSANSTFQTNAHTSEKLFASIAKHDTLDATRNLDATFENTPAECPTKTSANSTFQAGVVPSGESSSIEQYDTLDLTRNFDATFENNPAKYSRKSSANSTCQKNAPSSGKLFATIEKRDTLNLPRNFDATFESAPAGSPTKAPANSTFETREPSSGKLSSVVDENPDAIPENAPVSSPTKSSIDSTFRTVQPASENLQIAKQNDTFNVQKFDATFERPSSTSPIKSSIDSTFKVPAVPAVKSSLPNDHDFNSTYKAPTRMDTTYEHNTVECRNVVPVTNRYNTYRKVPERTRKENYPTNNLTAKVDENVDTVNRGASLENLGSTFRKPAARAPSKLNAPRALSRLPQTLQKSNPNLISNSLKSINTVGRSAIPSFGFRKIARPSTVRNVEGSLSGKLYAMGKVKSGSEQRLEVTRNPVDFQMAGTGGSTESIESTQSAHSAPDFDDRLSVCSDSSNTSYSMRSMNIDDLQKIVRLREESLKSQSTPEPKRQVLENTWVEASKNLPSPILKQDPENYSSRGSSPRSMDSTVKTSSPLLSPAGSLQNLTIHVSDTKIVNNTRGNKLTLPREENLGVKKLSAPSVKPPKSAGEARTGLRPPGNWSTTNRPASGIPRPASRIPAPRFVRPAAKSNQGDIKKGYL